MKTDDLVAMLSASVEPVDRRLVVRTVCVAVAAASVFALGIILIGPGIRPDLMTARAFTFLITEACVHGCDRRRGVDLSHKVGAPRRGAKTPSIMVAMPFIVIALLAAISLGFAPRSHWDAMIAGDQWLECLLSIPIIAIVPFAITIWAVRSAAHKSRPHRCHRRPHFWWRECNGLCASLHR
jgi:hypothetical protein